MVRTQVGSAVIALARLLDCPPRHSSLGAGTEDHQATNEDHQAASTVKPGGMSELQGLQVGRYWYNTVVMARLMRVIYLPMRACVRACVRVQQVAAARLMRVRPSSGSLLVCMHTFTRARSRANTHTHTVARRGGCADGSGDDDKLSASVAGRLGSVRRQLVYQC